MSRPAFQELQLQFSAHLRDPEHVAPPADIEERRLAIYRRLIFNNARNFMFRGFPVLRRTLGEDTLLRLVRDWLREHRARTPLFPSMSSEFVAWLATAPAAITELPPWVPALAHYEWVETELNLADAAPVTVRRRALSLSPLARVLAYDWPVHRIRPQYQPTEPQRTLLLVHRDAAGKVRFHEISPMTYLLLKTLEGAGPLSTTQLLNHLEVERKHLPAARELLDDLITKEIVLCAH